MAEEQGNPYGQLIAKAWTDEEFKARLLADPKAAMKEVGMDVPEGMEVEVVESTQEKAYLVIPAKPGPGELSDEDLDNVAGGWRHVGTVPGIPRSESPKAPLGFLIGPPRL